MNAETKYEVIKTARLSRLLFRTQAEYREALGTSADTIYKKRESERDMDIYYGIIDRKASQVVDCKLEDVVRNYVHASEFYLSLDWGDRKQMVSRQNFCRLLFRLYATVGRDLAAGEVSRFKTKDSDERLLKTFFPNGTSKEPAADVVMILLFAYDIIRPWDQKNSRGHDIEDGETVESLEKLHELITVLKEEIPRIGSTEKPVVFNNWLSGIENKLKEPVQWPYCTPLWMIAALTDIAITCRTVMIPARQSREMEKFQGLYMGGIWVDDADRGANRFWVFPDNMLGVFCYRRKGIDWELKVYDFRVRLYDSKEYRDTFIMLAPEENLRYSLSPERAMDYEHVAVGSFEDEEDEVTGESVRQTFHEDPQQFPAWFDWRSWERLSPDDPRHEEFSAVLSGIYDQRNPLSLMFRNASATLVDKINNFVGRDSRYLYVYDRRPARFVMREKHPGSYYYEGTDGEDYMKKGLLELEISPEHPLYVIPTNMKEIPDVEKKKALEAGKKAAEAQQKAFEELDIDRLADILTDARNIDEVYVVHSESITHPRLLIPTYGFTMALDMNVLEKLGVKKLTAGLLGGD